jgi:two-component system, response regulator PdtaR
MPHKTSQEPAADDVLTIVATGERNDEGSRIYGGFPNVLPRPIVTGEAISIVCGCTHTDDRSLQKPAADEALTVVEALSAVNADQALEIDTPDVKVIFTDVNLPGSMDGLTLANSVKQKWPRIALIVTSGKISSTILEQVPEGDRFFSKPYVLSDLIRAISDMR